AARAGEGPETARARQVLWARLLIGARARLMDAIAAGDAAAAVNWLTIRDYARASGDTAASLAVQALGQGTLAPAAAQESVAAEYATIAAAELRLALGRAEEAARAGHATQYAGEVGRIEGMVAFLDTSLATHLGPDGLAALNADLARAAGDPAAIDALAARLALFVPVALS